MSLSTTSTDASLSSLSSISTTPALTTQTTVAQTPTSSPFPTGFGGGHGGGGGNGGGGNGGGGNNNNNTGGTLATSAALYLYTFLATLVLLLSVSAAIVIRSFILRRRHRRMVEEAIRNGTWVSPSPPSGSVRVDLSKKPVLWEAYIDNKRSISYSHGGGKSLNPEWMMDQTKYWDMIRPISAAYLASSTALGPMTSVPTATDSTPQNPIPGPTPVEEPSHPAASTRTPRHRAIFSRAMRMLNPRPVETSPLPTANLSNANINTGGSGAGEAHILMTELDEKTQSPSLMRVAVLIAMPSPPSSSSSTAPSTATSVIISSPPPPINPTTSPAKLSTVATQSHPLQINPAFPLPLPPPQDDEPLLPHIEVGVADVLVVPPDLVTQDERINKRKFRGSVGSRDSVASEGNPG